MRRAQQRERAPLASSLVLPGTSKVTAESYFTLTELLGRAKNLTDVLVCWMERNGYRELTLRQWKGREYQMTLKAAKEKGK